MQLYVIYETKLYKILYLGEDLLTNIKSTYKGKEDIPSYFKGIVTSSLKEDTFGWTILFTGSPLSEVKTDNRFINNLLKCKDTAPKEIKDKFVSRICTFKDDMACDLTAIEKLELLFLFMYQIDSTTMKILNKIYTSHDTIFSMLNAFMLDTLENGVFEEKTCNRFKQDLTKTYNLSEEDKVSIETSWYINYIKDGFNREFENKRYRRIYDMLRYISNMSTSRPTDFAKRTRLLGITTLLQKDATLKLVQSGLLVTFAHGNSITSKEKVELLNHRKHYWYNIPMKVTRQGVVMSLEDKVPPSMRQDVALRLLDDYLGSRDKCGSQTISEFRVSREDFNECFTITDLLRTENGSLSIAKFLVEINPKWKTEVFFKGMTFQQINNQMLSALEHYQSVYAYYRHYQANNKVNDRLFYFLTSLPCYQQRAVDEIDKGVYRQLIEFELGGMPLWLTKETFEGRKKKFYAQFIRDNGYFYRVDKYNLNNFKLQFDEPSQTLVITYVDKQESDGYLG